jgi:hypothetical protein
MSWQWKRVRGRGVRGCEGASEMRGAGCGSAEVRGITWSLFTSDHFLRRQWGRIESPQQEIRCILYVLRFEVWWFMKQHSHIGAPAKTLKLRLCRPGRRHESMS